MHTPTTGGPTAAIVPFPNLPSAEHRRRIRIEKPWVLGTLRAIVGGTPIASPIEARPHSLIRANLARGLERTGRSFYFAESSWDADEFWLRVLELKEPVRVIEWPNLVLPVIFGAEALQGAQVIAGAGAAILPFRCPTLQWIVDAGGTIGTQP